MIASYQLVNPKNTSIIIINNSWSYIKVSNNLRMLTDPVWYRNRYLPLQKIFAHNKVSNKVDRAMF